MNSQQQSVWRLYLHKTTHDSVAENINRKYTFWQFWISLIENELNLYGNLKNHAVGFAQQNKEDDKQKIKSALKMITYNYKSDILD